MNEMKLTKRLEAVAGYVRQGARAADVGTDHGYIPAFLTLSGRVSGMIASDNKIGPLRRAEATAAEYGVSDRIEFVLTDGLDGLNGRRIDTVILAGMGGETMAGILQRAPWTRGDRVRLILQPQTKRDELEAWLSLNGYGLTDASLVLDEGRYYIVMTAAAGGSRSGALRLLCDKKDKLLPDYLEFLIGKNRRAAEGARRASAPDGDTLDTLDGELRKLVRLKEETETWQL